MPYVAALVFHGLTRHKVNLPNHWKLRRLRRAVAEAPQTAMIRKINKMAAFVKEQIANFDVKMRLEAKDDDKAD